MNTITICIAEDHPIFRKGLKDIISEENHLLVIGDCGDGKKIIPMLKELMPDILLLDLNFHDERGLGLTIAEQVQREDIPVKIIIITGDKEEGLFNRALDLDVRGYILKECAATDVLDCIRIIQDDQYYISPIISTYLAKRRKNEISKLNEIPNLETLTEKERTILRLIADGKTSKEIAETMFISIRTVQNRRFKLCDKLALKGTNALFKFAIEQKSSL